MRVHVLVLSATLASCFSGLSGLSGGEEETPAPDRDGGGPGSGSDGGDAAIGDDGDTQVTIDASTTHASRYRDAVMSDTPLAYFRFEETSGTTEKDETGAHDGTWLTTPAFSAPGAFEGSAAVILPKGSSARFSVPGTSFRFSGNAAYAVEVWLRPATFKNYDWIVSTEAPRVGWSILADATGALHYEVWDVVDGGPSAVRYLVPATNKLASAAWQHVVLTYDGTRAAFYVNGVSVRDDPWPAPAPDVGALLVGCRDNGDGTTEHCLDDWSIDDLAIYSHALAEARIQLHYAIASAQ